LCKSDYFRVRGSQDVLTIVCCWVLRVGSCSTEHVSDTERRQHEGYLVVDMHTPLNVQRLWHHPHAFVERIHLPLPVKCMAVSLYRIENYESNDLPHISPTVKLLRRTSASLVETPNRCNLSLTRPTSESSHTLRFRNDGEMSLQISTIRNVVLAKPGFVVPPLGLPSHQYRFSHSAEGRGQQSHMLFSLLVC
jgi:hypothetical protein